MRLPVDMAELESMCWSLAGERVTAQPLVAVLVHADAHAADVLRRVAGGEMRQSVDAFFADPEVEALQDELAPHEWSSLVRAFLKWAGDATAAKGASQDEWVPAIEGLDEPPPRRRGELNAWLMKHGVRKRLDDPLAAAAPLARSFRAQQEIRFAGPKASIGDALEGRVPKRYRAELEEAARSYLAWAAGRLRRRRHREETWAREPASEQVGEAAARVRALLVELDRDEVPAVPIPAEGARIGITEDTYAFGLELPSPHGYGVRMVWVHLLERRHQRAMHSLDDPRAVRAPEQLRLCAELALDALLDPEEPLHRPLREALEKPRWTHLLQELEREVQPEPTLRPFEEDERLVWRVGQVEDELVVEPALQKKRKRGWTKGRKVEATWLESRPAPLDPRDEAAVRAWREGNLWRREEPVGLVLEALVGHPRVVAADDPKLPLRVRKGGLDVRLVDRDGELWLSFRMGERVLEPHELLERHVFPRHVAFLDLERADVTVLEVPDAVFQMASSWARWETGLPRDADAPLLALLERLPPHVGLELPPRLRGERLPPDLRPVLRLEPLPGGGLRATVAMRPLPKGPVHPPGEGPLHLVGTVEGRRAHVVRDHAAERKAAERVVSQLGLDGGVGDGPHAFRLDDPEQALDVVAALRADPEAAAAEWPEDLAPWRVVGGAGFSNLKVQGRKLSQWFEVKGEAKLDEGKVTLAQIMAALREGRRYVALGKGRFARIEDDLRARLERAQDVVFADGKELGVAGAALGALEELLPEDVLEADASWREARERLRAAEALEPEVPGGLRAELRDYQREGVQWLSKVAAWAPGACLADDMGLGKTLQALALVLERAGEGPAMVVCPTSVSDNWRKECERFAPALRPRMYRGADREGLLEGLAAGDLVITSYDIMLRDAEALGAVGWSTIVYDEAHALKNPETQRAKAAQKLEAGFRLGLTGTPLENHLGELWSLFSILVPGLLGPWRHFRERFAIPIEREGDLERRATLRDLLRPFLLRRTKAQVAPELPPRVDVVRTVELSDDERALYEAERRNALEKLATQADDPKKRFAVLAALTRLRRLACHPVLVHPESRVKSSKLAEAVELAADLRGEGHRALVFSQFTSHLQLVERALEKRGMELLYLDGSTPAGKRGELVERWQAGEGDFFLISLKAGGTGLNLTAADTVIHLDPWWNPAAEDQASDRTHRIGQDKPVTVIRLVSQDTIEETVLALHEEKRELARGILEGAETNAKLSTSELLALLEG